MADHDMPHSYRTVPLSTVPLSTVPPPDDAG